MAVEEECVKFYLIEQMGFSLSVMVAEQSGEVTASASCAYVSQCLDGVKSVPSGDSCPGGDWIQKLTDQLNFAFLDRRISITFELQCRKSYDPVQRKYGKGVTEFRIASLTIFPFDWDVGRHLKEVLGEDGVFLQVAFEEWTDGDRPPRNFTTKVMSLASPQNEKGFVCLDDSYNPVIDSLVPRGNRELTGTLSLILITTGCEPSEKDKMGMYKRMLEEELASDAVIVSGNGAEVKCHRGILAMHSPVFQAMFGTDMQEAKTRRIEMPDMSEESVRAFLAYLYHWETSKAVGDCSVALELLKAGHKYNIGILEKAMRRLLLLKPDAWYEVEVAMKLYLFVCNLDTEWESLKKKAVMVMKKTPMDLEKSATFQDLFEKDPKAAMKFYQYSMSIWNQES